MNQSDKVLVILGLPGIDMTRIAAEVALLLDGEVIPAGPIWVYRRMDIGTGKPTPELRTQVPFHMIDLVNPDEYFRRADYINQAREIIREILQRGHQPLLIGNNDLAINAIIGKEYRPHPHDSNMLDMEIANPAQKQQLAYRLDGALDAITQLSGSISETIMAQPAETQLFAATWFRLLFSEDELRTRIDQHVDEILQSGLLEEVLRLHAQGYNRDLPTMRQPGYFQLNAHLNGGSDFAAAAQSLKRYLCHQACNNIDKHRSLLGAIQVEMAEKSELEVAQEIAAIYLNTNGNN